MANGYKTGGRKKGVPNKLTQDVISRLKELKCDPIEGMATIAKKAKDDKDYHLAGMMYKELAQYVAPKRKSIDHTSSDGSMAMPSRIELISPDDDGKD